MPTPFVGRREENAQMDEAVEAAVRGEGAAVLVVGEPGIGKSRLVEEAAKRAESRGCMVVVGRAWEAEGTPAYWPWLEAIRTLDARTNFVSRAKDENGELAALLGRAGTPAADPSARFRLFDAVVGLLRSAAAEKPLIVILDDIHAADEATLELAHFVARTLRSSPVALFCTSRDATFARDEIRPLLEKIAREATTVRPRRLARGDVEEWLGSTSLDAAAIHVASEGNPLFVEELVAASRAGSAKLPLGISGAIRTHLSLLPAASRDLLEIASVLGRDVPIDLLRGMAGDIAPLDGAVEAGVVTRSETAARFAHILLRDELYGQIPALRRAELHAKAALALRDRPSLAAHHVLESRLPDGVIACEIIEAAMSEAVGRFAMPDAVALGERALASLALPTREEVRLRVAIGEAAILGGLTAKGKEWCRKAADMAESIGDGELLARAALAYTTEIILGRHEDIIEILKRALEALPESDSPLRAQVLGRLGLAMIPALPEEGDGPLRFCREGVEMARRVKDDATLFVTLRMATSTFPEDVDIRTRFAMNAESISLAKRLGRIPHVVQILAWQVACWLELGNMNGALEEAAAAEALMASLPHPHHQWRPLLVRSMLAAIDGRFAEADAIGRRVLRLVQENDVREGLVHLCIQRMSLPFLGGDPKAYAEMDPIVMRTLGHMSLSAIFLSLGDAIMGRVDRARAGIELGRASDLTAMPGAAQLGWTVVWAGLHDHAEFFYDIARKSRGTILFGPGAVVTLGPTDLLCGKLAAMLGRRADALAHYEKGLAFSRELGARAFIDQLERAIAELGERRVEKKPSSTPLTMERRGEMWSVGAGSRTILVKDAKGFAYLDALVKAPHREVHVLQLVGADDDGDAGPMLDERAKREYRARADELRGELDEAMRNNDLGRTERVREELDALAGELSRAVGLGGKDRRAGSTSERARINVQRRLKDAIRRITEQDEEIGRHLERSVKTGAFCVYSPIPL